MNGEKSRLGEHPSDERTFRPKTYASRQCCASLLAHSMVTASAGRGNHPVDPGKPEGSSRR